MSLSRIAGYFECRYPIMCRERGPKTHYLDRDTVSRRDNLNQEENGFSNPPRRFLRTPDATRGVTK